MRSTIKKLIATTMVGVAACASSSAQGNLEFTSSSASRVWDNFSTPGVPVKAGPTLEVALMWSANLSAVPTTFQNGLATPTNGLIASWTGIFTDPNFHLALSTAVGNPIIETTAGGPPPIIQGQYTAGIQYILGSSEGQQVQLYVLGWDKSFGLDPVLAAQSNAPVGFSATLLYTLGSAALQPPSLGNSGISGFGVSPVPEPTSVALTGLAVMLIRRRRK